MREFQGARLWNRFAHSKFALFLLLVLLVLLLKAAVGAFWKMRESANERRIAEEELAELKARADALSKEVERLETPKGVEEEVRRQFNVVKDGEEVAIILNAERASVSEETSQDSWWQRFLSWFDLAR